MKIENNYRLFTKSTIAWIGVCILITGLLQSSNDLAVYLWYFFPGVLLFLLIPFFLCWKCDMPQGMFMGCNYCILVVTAVIFFTIFYEIFNPSHSFTFEKVEDCQITGQMNANLLGAENYSILYVDLKYGNDNLLGYGCLSDLNQDYKISSIHSFKFYRRDESYSCGPVEKGDSYNITSRRALSNDRTRLLRIRTKFPVLRLESGGCQTNYTFSDVKLPSWMCLSKENDIIFTPQTCYVSFYKENALQVAQKRMDLRKTSSFAMVTFDKDIYYPKSGFFCLIIFAYLPFLMSIHSICAFFCYGFSLCFCPDDESSKKQDKEEDRKSSEKQKENQAEMIQNHHTPSIANSHHVQKYINAQDNSIDAHNQSNQTNKGGQNRMQVDYFQSNLSQRVNPADQSYNNQNASFI